MSSIIGHAAVGGAICLASTNANLRKHWPVFALFTFAAVAPDLDYLPAWIAQIHLQPRFTHSLIFCLALGLGCWAVLRVYASDRTLKVPVLALLACACVHPLLDLCVGSHPVPLFWPLPVGESHLPFGILPSAGRLSLGNYYLWRNLGIECAVLFPPLYLLVAKTRGWQHPLPSWAVAVLIAIWLVALTWSISLQR